ncbi:hypothetical protein [Flavobacterium selenitireducens]|uniref:hypothetical protein n=1 Tax=Flavobacterium selenitireducens TaxID=2722704 RepID=UPI00168AAA32|nr:hypothetical protein [Flavobacterium selenitireducens]MBD3582922.1 hypothetical protein [Flavobacterium selenitireducens]
MKHLIALILLLVGQIAFAQTDSQLRYTSSSRQFFMWNDKTQSYELKDNEEEHSMIDIREQVNKASGYAVLSMTDDGKTRMFHGNITAYQSENGESIWSLRSKILKSRIVLNAEKRTLTYSYEANNERYMKIFVFKLDFPE